MSVFKTHIQLADPRAQPALSKMVRHLDGLIADYSEGTKYGMPSFLVDDKGVIGFSSKETIVNLYPYDPPLLASLKPQLTELQVEAGVARFDCLENYPKRDIELLVLARLESMGV